jgi:hypothetical protein
MGNMERSTDPHAIEEILRTLDTADREHFDISIRLPDGWTVSAFADGNLVFENIEARPVSPRHMKSKSRADALRLMELLAAGDADALESEPWLPGYPWSAK